MVRSKIFLPLLLVMLLASQAGCDKDESSTTYPLTLRFKNKAGSTDLTLNAAYTNPFGEAITITNFKYYITNISLVTTSGKEEMIPDTYYLVDEKSGSSKSISLRATNKEYKAIHFLIGVDSARNVSGVQTGALDPANAMFWTWNTGYIQAKLEGNSPVSTEPLSAVEYHIGGFKTGENTVRPIGLALPTNLILNTIAPSEVIINADAMKWFNGAHDIKITDAAYCTTPGNLAVSIADNYATMFSVAEVINR